MDVSSRRGGGWHTDAAGSATPASTTELPPPDDSDAILAGLTLVDAVAEAAATDAPSQLESGPPSGARSPVAMTELPEILQSLRFASLTTAPRPPKPEPEAEPEVMAEPEVVSESQHWMMRALRDLGFTAGPDFSIPAEADITFAWDAAQDRFDLSPVDLAGVVARHFRVSALNLVTAQIQRLEDLPDTLVRKHKSLPVAFGDHYVLIAVSDPADVDIEHDFRVATRRTVLITVAPPAMIADAIWNTYGWAV